MPSKAQSSKKKGRHTKKVHPRHNLSLSLSRIAIAIAIMNGSKREREARQKNKDKYVVIFDINRSPRKVNRRET